MKTLTVVAMGALLLLFFFQCCPSETTEVRPPGEEAPAPLPVEEPTPAPVGLSPDNPVPLGYALVASNGAVITVQGIRARGEEATRLALEWNMFNNPDPGNEYVILSASVAYEGGGYADTLSISDYDFKVAVGTLIFDPPFVHMEGNELEGEMLPGGRIDGLLVFEVPQGSTGIILIYDELLWDSYYFATE